MLVLIYISVNALASQIIIKKGINPQGLRNNNPLYKLVSGLNHDTLGTYSKEDVALINDPSLTREERRDLELSLIKERLSKGPLKLLSLFIGKQHLLWGGDPLYWSYQHLLTLEQPVRLIGFDIPIAQITQLVLSYHNLQIFLLIALSLWGAVWQLKVPHDHSVMVYYLILLLSVGAYFFVEIQPRYIYLQEFVLFISAAKGIEAITFQIDSKEKSEPGA